MNKNLLFKKGVIVALFSIFGLVGCEPETKTYLSYSLSAPEQSGMTQELANFVQERITQVNTNNFGSRVIESEQANSIFNNFCSTLDAQATAQNIRIFADTWVVVKLSDVMRNVVAERKVMFTKNADPKRWAKISVNEIAPSGDTVKVTEFLDGLLIEPLSLVKSSKTEGNIKTNTYSFYKEYATYDEAKNYLAGKKSALDKLCDNIDKQLPTATLYTGKITVAYEAVDESIGSTESSSSIVLHKPLILGTKGWATAAVGAKIPSLVFAFNRRDVVAPFFVSYKTMIDGTQYEVYRQGHILVVLNENGSIKYGFVFISATEFQLTQQDGVNIKDGPVYSKVE